MQKPRYHPGLWKFTRAARAVGETILSLIFGEAYFTRRDRAVLEAHRTILAGRIYRLNVAVDSVKIFLRHTAKKPIIHPGEYIPMANALLDNITSDIAKATTVIDGAVTFINGVPALIRDAVDAAIANGATAAQLQPISEAADNLEQKAEALKAAVLANTPSAPPAPPA